MGEVLEHDDADDDWGAGRRYVAMVSEVPGAEAASSSPSDAPASSEPPAADLTHPYATDLPIAAVSTVLAVSTFLPWYHGPKGFGISVSGWSSGTWGPVIFFLALGSLALIALRRVNVSVSLPVEESLVHEGAGWISLVGAVVKSRFHPGVSGLLGTSWGVWIAIALSAGLIILAGRMAPHAPFVLRPGWARGRAGIVGLSVLAIVVAGSAVFGATNSASLRPSGRDSRSFSGSVSGKLPECAKGFALPAGLKPEFGFGAGTACSFELTSAQTPVQVAKAFKTLFKAKRYTYSIDPGAPGSTVFSVTKPRCAKVAIVPGMKGSIVGVSFTSACPTPSPRA
jgi:hypothetical protein